MKLKLLAAALALAASATVSAAPTGESSNYNTIDTRQPSTAIPFGAGKAALRINNSSIRINIGDGPVKHINKNTATGRLTEPISTARQTVWPIRLI